MNDIIRLLPKLLEAAGDNHEFTESLAMVAWTRAVGEGLRVHTIPVRLARSYHSDPPFGKYSGSRSGRCAVAKAIDRDERGIAGPR